jgi:hypothetical protein
MVLTVLTEVLYLAILAICVAIVILNRRTFRRQLVIRRAQLEHDKEHEKLLSTLESQMALMIGILKLQNPADAAELEAMARRLVDH